VTGVGFIVGIGIGATVRSLSCGGGITDTSVNPRHLGAEGNSVFGMGVRVPTQVNSSLVPASRLPAVAVVAPRQGCHLVAQV